MLDCNKSEIRKRYLEMEDKLPAVLIENLVVRHLLLAENELFENEWETLNAQMDVDPFYKRKRKEFLDRWFIQHPSGLHDIGKLPSLYARVVDSRIEKGNMTIEVDLYGPKEKILSEVEGLISSWRKEFNDRLGPRVKTTFSEWMKNKNKYDYPGHHNLKFERGNFERRASLSRLEGNLKRGDNFEDYFTNIEVFVAKKNKSWAEIVKQFGFKNISDARWARSSANKLVKNGFPGLPPFPLE